MKRNWKEWMVKVKKMVDGFFDDDMLLSETKEKELITNLKQRLEKLKMSYNRLDI